MDSDKGAPTKSMGFTEIISTAKLIRAKDNTLELKLTGKLCGKDAKIIIHTVKKP